MLNEAVQFINSQVSGANAQVEQRENGDSVVYVDPSSLYQVCESLKKSPEFNFNVLEVVTGCDFPEEKIIEVSYVLASFSEKKYEMILKVKLPRDNPQVDSVCSVWKSANFQERECYDMLGVTFKNHPDHRRILCPDDWEGYPLRKDYVVQKVYREMEVNPEPKMNIPDRSFADRQKEQERLKKAKSAGTAGSSESGSSDS